MSSPKIFFIEGNIGTGKSTFLKMVEKYNSDTCQVIYEPVDTWTNFKDSSGKNILQYFYENPQRYAYPFQNTAFVSRVEKIGEIDNSKKYIFVERSIWSDRNIFAKNCFETGLMNEIEHLLYEKWFSWLEKNLKLPAYEFVYLRTSPETSFARMKERARSEESGVTLEYLAQIHQRHEDWFKCTVQNKSMTTLSADPDFTKKEVFDEYFSFICTGRIAPN
jgi:deoxyadenosine/deoxycytidine kinase